MNNLPQFFINSKDISGGEVVITGSDTYHLIKVRRVKSGDDIILRAEDGKGFIARVSDITNDCIRASIINELQKAGTLPDITLFMALLKGGNFEFVIQKSVEIGVARIVPVVTERTIPDPVRMDGKKIDRWEKIVSEASKQCLRSVPALIEPPVYLKDVFSMDISDLKIICHPGAGTPIKQALNSSVKKEKISLLIGPEGGFSDREIANAGKAGWIAANFGATHLRAETAAMVLPSIVVYEWS